MSLDERTVRKIIREEIVAHDKHKSAIESALARVEAAKLRRVLWETELGFAGVYPKDEGEAE